MALTFEVYDGADWQDLSDYVLSSAKIPYILRNRDYETVAPVVSLTISQATSLLNKGNKVRIKSGATFIFSGHILTIKDDAARRVWRIGISSALYKLRDYNCNYGTLHADISTTGSDYEDYAPAAGDSEGFPNVRVLFLLKRMFVIAGLTLDVSAMEGNVYFSEIFQAVSYNILYKDIKIDEQALYAINQSLVGRYAPSQLSPDKSSEISFLDFLQKVCAAMGLTVHLTGDLAFILYSSGLSEIIETEDDDKYDYNSEEITARDTGYNFRQYFGATLGNNFRNGYNGGGGGGAAVKLQYEQGDGNKSLSWYNHLFFLVRHKINPAITNATHSGGIVTVTTTGMSDMDAGDYVIIENVQGMTDLNDQLLVTEVQDPTLFKVSLTTAQSYSSGGDWKFAGVVYLDYSVTRLLEKKIREATDDYREERIMIPVNTTARAVIESLIDFRTQTSNIRQEIYGDVGETE